VPPPDYEVSLLRLLEKVTNGSVIEISVTGTVYFTVHYAVTHSGALKVPLYFSNQESYPAVPLLMIVRCRVR